MMGIFDFFHKNKRFVSEKDYVSNVERQGKMNAATLAELGKYGVTEESQLSLEFFFYTGRSENAEALAEQLKGLGYRIERTGPSAADAKKWCVSGWTTRMKMNLSTVTGWTKQMCALGYENDGEFDGWGTNPQQP